MTAHFKPPRSARLLRRPANVLQFREQRSGMALREWWSVVAVSATAFVAILAWPAPEVSVVNSGAQFVAAPDAVPWRGQRSAAELEAEQPSAGPADEWTGGADSRSASFSICAGGARVTCVIDGDTFWYRGEKIRIADINTPEISSPKCPAEAALGARATGRLLALLNSGPFSLARIDRDTDRYGRKLRIVTRRGASLGAVLVDEGLAEPWQGFRRDWC